MQGSRIFWHTHEDIPAKAVTAVWHLSTFLSHLTNLIYDTQKPLQINTTDCHQCNKIFTQAFAILYHKLPSSSS